MRRGRIAWVATLVMLTACGSDKTADFLASSTTAAPASVSAATASSTTVAQSTSVYKATASTTTVATGPLDVGATVNFEQRFDGVTNIAKFTLESTQWTTTHGAAGGSDPSTGTYLIVTASVECITGVCGPGAGHFIFRGVDGRFYYAIGPGENGHIPALGYAPPIQKVDLSKPLTAGQSVTGVAAIDTPHIAGVVYLVGVNALATVTTLTPPNSELRGAVAGWKVAA
jgi:hypothetical protein